MAVCSGNVWETRNAGTTWQPIFDDQGSYSIGCLAIDPTDPNVIWVGTGENNSQRSVSYGDGVYKSRDGGKSWENMGLEDSEHIGMIRIDNGTKWFSLLGQRHELTPVVVLAGTLPLIATATRSRPVKFTGRGAISTWCRGVCAPSPARWAGSICASTPCGRSIPPVAAR